MSFIDFLFGRTGAQLDRIELSLKRLETRMSQQETDLDNVLVAVQEAQAQNSAATDELISLYTQAVENGKIDLGDETAAFQAVLDRMKSTNDQINAALPAPPPSPVL